MRHDVDNSASSQVIWSALINAGYRVSQSHTNPLALKTDAPQEFLWDVMRHWVQQHPVKHSDGDTAGSRILAKPATCDVDFSYAKGSDPPKTPRWLPNPEEHWGPKAIPKRKRKADADAAGGLDL